VLAPTHPHVPREQRSSLQQSKSLLQLPPGRLQQTLAGPPISEAHMVFPCPVLQQISVLGLHGVCRPETLQTAAQTPPMQAGVALPTAQQVVEA
jgi:hypothetical protein